MPKKRVGLGQFADLMGGLAYPNAHYELGNNFNCDFNLLMPMPSLLISNNQKYALTIDRLLAITVDVVRR